MKCAAQNKNSGDSNRRFAAEPGQRFLRTQYSSGVKRDDDHYRDDVRSDPLGDEEYDRGEQDQQEEDLLRIHSEQYDFSLGAIC